MVLSSRCSGKVGLWIAVSLVAYNFLSRWVHDAVFDPDTFISVFEVLRLISVLIRRYIWLFICSDCNDGFHRLCKCTCASKVK